MTYPNILGNDRALAFSTLCGGDTETRDDVTSKILLDDPMPQLPAVVRACAARRIGLAPRENTVEQAVVEALARKTHRALEVVGDVAGEAGAPQLTPEAILALLQTGRRPRGAPA